MTRCGIFFFFRWLVLGAAAAAALSRVHQQRDETVETKKARNRNKIHQEWDQGSRNGRVAAAGKLVAREIDYTRRLCIRGTVGTALRVG